MGFDLVLDTTDTLEFVVAHADGESAYQSTTASVLLHFLGLGVPLDPHVAVLWQFPAAYGASSHYSGQPNS